MAIRSINGQTTRGGAAQTSCSGQSATSSGRRAKGVTPQLTSNQRKLDEITGVIGGRGKIRDADKGSLLNLPARYLPDELKVTRTFILRFASPLIRPDKALLRWLTADGKDRGDGNGRQASATPPSGAREIHRREERSFLATDGALIHTDGE